MLKRFCDCCNKEIKETAFYYTLKVTEYNESHDQSSVYPTEELCENCNIDLSSYYRNMKMKKMGVKFI